MPLKKQVEALEHLCFMKVATIIHDIAVSISRNIYSVGIYLTRNM